MTKIERPAFTGQHQGQTIDLNKLKQNQAAKTQLEDGGMTTEQLERADKNRDGKIDGDEAFNVADDFDRDGSRSSLVATDRAGAATPAGKALSSLGLLMQNREVQGGLPRQPTNDAVLYVGMNNPTLQSSGSPYELQQLRALGLDITGILDSRVGQDKIRVSGQTYDLATADGRTDFVATLGLPAEQSRKVADALAASDPKAKDEMAAIAQVWAKAEHGGTIPSRLIIAGHNVGSGPWGDENGQLYWDPPLKMLAQAMPKAAAAVEDLNISACYSGGEANEAIYRDLFPNLRTIWAYSGSAPGAASGATAHQEAWERATRGSGTDVAGTAQRLASRGVRKADKIATWAEGVAPAQGRSLEELRNNVSYGDYSFRSYFSGETPVADSQSGPLREYYNNLQALLQRTALPGDERRHLESRRDQTIRTLFYTSNVAPSFQHEYGAEIAAGYQALGQTPPNFGTMSRLEAVGAIERYRLLLDQTGNTSAAAQRTLQLLNGLWNLDSRTIPNNWI